MSPTDTLVTEPTEATGDSPAGGSTTPPTPVTPPDLPPARPREHSFLGRLTIGVMLVGLGVLAILDNIDSVPIDTEPRHYMALAVTILGAGLLVGSVAGRARWLIVVGAVMVPTLIFSPVFEYDWRTQFNVVEQPATFEDLSSVYTSNVGRLEVDLTRLPWDGEEVPLNLSLDVGQLTLRLPTDVGVIGTADTNIGDVDYRDRDRFFQRSDAGIGQNELDLNEPGTAGTVLLDAHVNVGSIDIERTGGNS